MTRGSLTERTLTILLLLLERPRTVKELATHFSVSSKTIARDMVALSLLLPLCEEPSSHDRREVLYSLEEDFKFDPPQLTIAELATLLLAQQSIALTGVTGARSPFAGAARSLLAKVRSAIPGALRDQLDALSSVYGSAATPAKDFAPHGEKIEWLTAAALAQRRLRMRYEGLTSNKTTDRLFDPYAVYFDPDGATLKTVGYDHTHQAIIPFAVDRIRALHQTDATFTRPADFDLRDYLTENCFNGIHGAPVNVTLRAHNVTARIFAERSFHPSQRIVERTEGKDESTTIEMRAASGRGLVRFILSWTPDVEVIAPDELRREIAATHRHALARYAEHAHKETPTPSAPATDRAKRRAPRSK